MIVLASASPRRKELLEAAGLVFVIDPAHVSEELAGETEPARVAEVLAERKARAVAARRGEEAAWILGADTVVAVADGSRWRLLGKPEDAAEARAMLETLSGSRHRVVTGVSVVRTPGLATLTASATTWVTMRALLADEVASYVASEEWRDKAGGYAIQENADAFVTRLEGTLDNVVGLPVRLALALLARSGAPGIPALLAEHPPEG